MVWFNFLAFTLMFAAFAFAFWLLLLATYRYFQAECIPGDHTAPELAIAHAVFGQLVKSAVIRLLAEGLTTKEIGGRRFASPHTVETHSQNVYCKCIVSNRVELLKLIETCRAR